MTEQLQTAAPDERDEFDDYEDDFEDPTCEACSGTGGDPMNDGITPCEVCDGEGYKWWL